MIPIIKIRSRTYKVEYEGLNLICFSCGRNRHQKESCQIQNSELNQTVRAETDNNDSSVPIISTEAMKMQQTSQEDTFGNWMIVKKITVIGKLPISNIMAGRKAMKIISNKCPTK